MTCFRMKDGRTVFSFLNKNKGLYSCFNRRIEKGDTIENALEYTLKKKERRLNSLKLIYNGVPLVDFCRENDLNYYTMRYKTKKGELK